MKIITIVCLFLILSLGFVQTFAQSTEFIGDTINVEIEGSYSGKIQWQFSTDKEKWENIQNGITHTLKYRTLLSGYIRAVISDCSTTFFSDTTNIKVDTQFNINPIEEKYKYSNRLWQGIPSIERTPNGRLWATYFSGDNGEGLNYYDNWAILVFSDDNGSTWSKPIAVVDPPGKEKTFEPGLWYGPDKKLWFTWSQTFGYYDGTAGVWASTTESFDEEHPKWTEPKRVADGVKLNKPIILRDSTILYPVALWEIYGGENNPNKGSNVYISKDKGNTISFLSRVRISQSTYNENMIIEKKDGTLWMLTRTSYGIGEVTSTDRGKTWINNKRSNLYNADARFHIRRLKSGNLLFIHHNPPNKDMSRSYLTASLSEDDGETWKYNLLIDQRNGVSYPDATSEDVKGNIYMIYDYDRNGQKNILTCRFTEKSIMSGSFSEIDLKPSIIKEGTINFSR